jgi:hypothetical protein
MLYRCGGPGYQFKGMSEKLTGMDRAAWIVQVKAACPRPKDPFASHGFFGGKVKEYSQMKMKGGGYAWVYENSGSDIQYTKKVNFKLKNMKVLVDEEEVGASVVAELGPGQTMLVRLALADPGKGYGFGTSTSISVKQV